RLGHVTLTSGIDGTRQLSVELTNRGLADIRVPLDLAFFAGLGEEPVYLGSTQVASLLSGARSQPSILVADEALTDDITVVLTANPAVTECEINNNITRAAL